MGNGALCYGRATKSSAKIIQEVVKAPTPAKPTAETTSPVPAVPSARVGAGTAPDKVSPESSQHQSKLSPMTEVPIRQNSKQSGDARSNYFSETQGSQAGSDFGSARHHPSRREGLKFDRFVPAQEDEEELPFRKSPSQASASSMCSESELDDESKKFLTKVMQNHFLFSSMDEGDSSSVFAYMKKQRTTKGKVIFRQGEKGDSCYFIRSGTYSVHIDGRKVKEMSANQTFGELALLYSMKRSATITCQSDGLLWKMDNAQFLRCMEHVSLQNNSKAVTFFGSDANFSCLSQEDQKLLASHCSVQRFPDGSEILREGEHGDWMFIIISGKVSQGDSSDVRQNPVIGSVGVIYDKLQATGARAIGPVICLAMGKSSLAQLPGPVEDVLRRTAIKALLTGLGESSIFSSMTNDQLHRLIGHFEDAVFEPNEIIFAPEDPAQLVLVIDGEVAMMKSLEPGEKALQKLTDGMAVGQEELMNGKCMSNYLVVTKRARMHRILYSKVVAAFGEPLAEAVRCNEVKKVLQDIFLFKNLREEQIDRTVRQLQQQQFEANEVVVRQDDPARHFFLIQEGTICVKKDDTVLRTLGRWDYFGERGLLLQERRSATCQALEACVCLVLDADVFFDIVGMFRKELERRMMLQDLNITIDDLVCKAVVGRGTFGVVRLVHHKLDEKKMYALKAVRKIEVVKNGQQKAIVMEREVNKQCYHPCIMQFIKTFQDKEHVYFLTEFLGGGDLFFAIREIGFLTKEHSQFFSGSIVLGLEYLHARGIMYRDLKPENVLLDFNGVAKLVDFGCCKKETRTHTLIGTPEYMAPEVIRGAGYTCTCDWWSLGVMLHEFVVGPLPFGSDAEDQMTLFSSICEDPLTFPDYINDEDVKTLIGGMLERKTERRLGSTARGAKEIKEHAYYSENGFKWDALAGGFLSPPFKPNEEALMKNWEAPDGELVNNIGSSNFNFSKGMDWARGF